MKYFIPLFLLAASGLGLVWTNDLYQNNNENQLIPKSEVLVPDPQSLVLHFLNNQPIRKELEQLLDTTELNYELIGPKELTGKNTLKEQLHFYQKFPQQILNAITENSTTYLLFLDPKEKRQYPLLFQKLQKNYSPSLLKLAGLPYLNYAISLKTADIKQFILPVLIALSLILSLFFIRDFYQTIVMFTFPFMSISISQILLKIIYNETNLLSTLTPLVSFVIVLSLSYHLYFGWKTYLNTKILLNKKFKPILIMILTTVIGVLSLAISDIQAIRSFAFSSSLSILVSTLLSIYLFAYLSRYFTHKAFQPLFKLPKIQLSTTLFWFLLIFPLCFSFFLTNIPTQIEALYFFKSIRVRDTNAAALSHCILGLHDLSRFHQIAVCGFIPFLEHSRF